MFFFPYLVQPIDYTSTRGGVSVLTNKAETTVSSLIIQKAAVEDGGVYSCQAGQIEPTSVKIHVLTGSFCNYLGDIFPAVKERRRRLDFLFSLLGDNLRGLHTNAAAVAWLQQPQRRSKNLILLLYLVFIRLCWW